MYCRFSYNNHWCQLVTLCRLATSCLWLTCPLKRTPHGGGASMVFRYAAHKAPWNRNSHTPRTFFPSGCKLLIWLVFEVFKDKELLCKVNFKYLRVCWKAKGDTNPPSCEALGEITWCIWVNSYSYAVCIYSQSCAVHGFICSHITLSIMQCEHDFLLVLKILHVSWKKIKPWTAHDWS